MKNIPDAIDEAIKDLAREDLIGPDNTIESIPEPDPSKAVVLSIVEALKTIEASGGYLGIARSNDVSTGTVKLVKSAINKRLTELSEAEIGEVPHEIIK